MKPSTKAELAINGMIELARCIPAKPLSLAVIAERQGISLSYLEQVFGALRRQGLVVSVRGPGGGYLLAKPTESISAGDIIVAVDGAHEPKVEPQTGFGLIAATNGFWAAMNDRILDLYDTVSLKSIIDGDFIPTPTLVETQPQAAE